MLRWGVLHHAEQCLFGERACLSGAIQAAERECKFHFWHEEGHAVRTESAFASGERAPIQLFSPDVIASVETDLGKPCQRDRHIKGVGPKRLFTNFERALEDRLAIGVLFRV